MSGNGTGGSRDGRNYSGGYDDSPREEIGCYRGPDDVLTTDKLASSLRHAGVDIKGFRPKGQPDAKEDPDISGNDLDSVRRLVKRDPQFGLANLTERLKEMIADRRRPYAMAGEIGVAADDLLAELQYHDDTGEYWSRAHNIEIARWWREAGREAVCKAIISVTGQKRLATHAELYGLATEPPESPLLAGTDQWGDW